MIWSDLEARAIPEPNSGCLIWLGPEMRRYGAAYDRRVGKTVRAHRLAYELCVGPIPDGLSVCHHCDVPFCINPNHLFVGTTLDNTMDMIRKGRAKTPTSAILTDEEVMSIFCDNRKYEEIAVDFDVGISTISCIKTGQQWSKVTGKVYQPPVKTHCNQGHPWVPENIGMAGGASPKKYCKICNRDRAMRNYLASKRRAK